MSAHAFLDYKQGVALTDSLTAMLQTTTDNRRRQTPASKTIMAH